RSGSADKGNGLATRTEDYVYSFARKKTPTTPDLIPADHIHYRTSHLARVQPYSLRKSVSPASLRTRCKTLCPPVRENHTSHMEQFAPRFPTLHHSHCKTSRPACWPLRILDRQRLLLRILSPASARQSLRPPSHYRLRSPHQARLRFQLRHPGSALRRA